jgi:cation transport regulator ChaC
MAFVFGYGSLVEEQEGQVTCHLEGYRRRWTVAMDNSVDLPGYKYYVDAGTGERPDVVVAFLNVEPDPGSAVNGVAFGVSEADLAALHERERNYEPVDVTASLREDLGDTVIAFVGRPDARERLERGAREGRAVVSAAYYEGVLDGVARLGAAALRDFTRSTDEPQCPFAALTRIDLP